MRQARHLVFFQQLVERLGVAEVAWLVVVFADDEALRSDQLGFIVFVNDAVVADQRIGHDDDLFGVGGIAENLLIADHRRVEYQLGNHFLRTAEALGLQLHAVL